MHQPFSFTSSHASGNGYQHYFRTKGIRAGQRSKRKVLAKLPMSLDENHNEADDDNVMRNNNSLPKTTKSSLTAATSTTKSGTQLRRLSKYLQAVFLIAGTTVGGGFLALPATVVIPLGGFLPSAAALVLVWGYLLSGSLILCDTILLAHTQQQEEKQTANSDVSTTSDISTMVNTTATTNTPIGIPRTARAALGTTGSRLATILLVSLTGATLVSQLSRAGSLFASQLGVAGNMSQYRIGCVLATLGGVAVTYNNGNSDSDSNSNDDDGNNGSSSSNETEETKGSAITTDTFNYSTDSSKTSFADKFNGVLTVVFLSSAVLLFQAVSGVADWSACWHMATPAATTVTTMPATMVSMGSTASNLFPKILEASPIMLQLLVYGEILPNVCRMLDFDRQAVRWAVLVGSLIPLMLLMGWAALGVALISPATIATASSKLLLDPVDIILATGSPAVQRRLLTLAVSAIGTTILGSFLALQSAYDDWKTMLPDTTVTGSDGKRSSVWAQSWMRALVIAAPAAIISLISPSIFLQAIDFAGSYPVLLLYGVLPPLMLHRLLQRNSSSVATHGGSNKQRISKWGVLVGAVSAVLIGLNVLSDSGWLVQKLLAALQ